MSINCQKNNNVTHATSFAFVKISHFFRATQISNVIHLDWVLREITKDITFVL